MGETFCEAITPPVPFASASAHECCEVIWSLLGEDVTPRSLTQLTDEQLVALSQKFGEYSNVNRHPWKRSTRQSRERWHAGPLALLVISAY